jgi:hypothetical protein
MLAVTTLKGSDHIHIQPPTMLRQIAKMLDVIEDVKLLSLPTFLQTQWLYIWRKIFESTLKGKAGKMEENVDGVNLQDSFSWPQYNLTPGNSW